MAGDNAAQVVSDAGIRETVRTLIHDNGRLAVDVATLPLDADLYDAGLSSMATVQLMLAIEEAFDLEFPDRLLNRGTFRSIAALSLAVTDLRAATPGR